MVLSIMEPLRPEKEIKCLCLDIQQQKENVRIKHKNKMERFFRNHPFYLNNSTITNLRNVDNENATNES